MSSMQADLAEQLYTFSIQEHDVCPRCKYFKDNIQHDYSTMLSTLGEYQDLSISELALLTLDFSRPQILPRRSGKRVNKFMSLKEPLADDWGPHQHEPKCSTTPVTSTPDMLFSNVFTLSQQHISGFTSSFIPPSQFTNTASAGASSYVPHVPPQSSGYDLDPSFFTTPSTISLWLNDNTVNQSIHL